jgi:hypothetical protein
LTNVAGSVICGIEDAAGARVARVACDLAARYALPLVFVPSLLGSVAADVGRRAPCPVVVVPPGIDAAEMQATPAIRASTRDRPRWPEPGEDRMRGDETAEGAKR